MWSDCFVSQACPSPFILPKSFKMHSLILPIVLLFSLTTFTLPILRPIGTIWSEYNQHSANGNVDFYIQNEFQATNVYQTFDLTDGNIINIITLHETLQGTGNFLGTFYFIYNPK